MIAYNNVGSLTHTYRGVQGGTFYGNYAFIAAIDAFSPVDTGDGVPIWLLDVRTGKIRVFKIQEDELERELGPEEASFLKVRCIIRIIASKCSDVSRMERIKAISIF